MNLLKKIFNRLRYERVLFRRRLTVSLPNQVFNLLNRVSGGWWTIHWRPKLASKVNTVPLRGGRSGESVFIVTQGPIILKDELTYENLKLHRKIFPKAQLILSTWKTENETQLEKIQKLGVKIVLSDLPKYRGFGNINFQMVSSRNGLQCAKDMGATKVLKSRTDLRFFDPNAMDFLSDLIESFPLANANGPQKKRLTLLGIHRKFRLFHFTDMALFGDIDDVLAYWSAPLDERQFSDDEALNLTRSAKSLARGGTAEMYVAEEFCKKMQIPYSPTLKDSWRIMGERFIVVDRSMIGYFFPKYEFFWEYRNLQYEVPRHKLEEFTFSEWLIMQRRFHEIEVPDLDKDIAF